jgi:hypothetical protein
MDDLRYFILDILDLWLRCPMLCFLAMLLGLIPLRLAVLGMSCNLSSDDWKLSCHLGTHSGCAKVHEACPPPMGQNILASLICSCFCLGALYSHFLPRRIVSISCARLLPAYSFSKQIQGQGYVIVFKMEMEYFY